MSSSYSKVRDEASDFDSRMKSRIYNESMSKMKNSFSKNIQKKKSSKGKWRIFQTIGPGVAVPIIHLKKLSALY